MAVSIILFICFLLSFIGLIILVGLYEYGIAMFLPTSVFYILFRVWFFHRCRKYIYLNLTFIKKINDYIQKKDINEGYIIFSSSNGVYTCVGSEKNIEFNLKGFLFKKSFIRAFIVRQLRYKTVSNKMKISKLFSINLKVKTKYDKLYLVIDNHKYLIISNKISKNTILSSNISKSKFGPMYWSIRTYVDSNIIMEIDEKQYVSWYSFLGKF